MILTVDVISDVICPWCYIGKRRLEKAIAAVEGQHGVRVHWHPFQLNPTMPKEGISRKEYRTKKFGSWERSQELDAKVIAVGESEGIYFIRPRNVSAASSRWRSILHYQQCDHIVWCSGPRDFSRCVRTGQYMKRIKLISKYLLAILMIVAGTMHFVNPEFFLKIVPPYLPIHRELVLVSGVCEILLGVLLLIPRSSRMAAWGIVALLIAVFPANIYLYQHQEILPASPLIHLLRLLLQGAFVLWAYWHTRPAERKS